MRESAGREQPGRPSSGREPARRGRPGDDPAASGLTGGGPSQLGINGSMRARDVSRPHEQDLVAAESLVQVSYRPRSRPLPKPHD